MIKRKDTVNHEHQFLFVYITDDTCKWGDKLLALLCCRVVSISSLMDFFLNRAELSLNSANSGNLKIDEA